MLEKHLIDYCSPTLACLKTASLFRLPYASKDELKACIQKHKTCLMAKGISITILEQSERSALIYVYRRDKLLQDLRKPGVARFLSRLGYACATAEEAVDHLRGRFPSGGEFPHEIGLFLGYPPWDVFGFIHYKGQHCKCSGYWKVYCRETEAKAQFAKFEHCKSIYRQLWQQGRSVVQLTVAA